MIPVVKVIESAQAMGDGSGSNKDKTTEQFQRQDSGFVSASQTPVTPSQYDIHGQPTISNHLPTIHEGMNGAPRLLQEGNLLSSQSQDQSIHHEDISGIRPSRPTTLSPHAPPPVPYDGDNMTPLTPGKVLRHLNENSDQLPDNLQEIIARRAEDIVKEVVPNTPIEEAHLPMCSKAQEEVLLSPYLLPLQQHVMYPVKREYLCPGGDGYYYEIRDYNRVDDEILGEGGFGTVYACSDKLYDTLFAIKCNNQSTDDKVMTMNRECGMLHGLAHNHITQCWGAFIDDYGPSHHRGKIWKMLMECATNGSLSDLLIDPDTNQPSGLPLDQSFFYLQQILFAVHYLHQWSILHRDLKCKNILVFNEGRIVKLTDFGSSIRLGDLHGREIRHLDGCTPNFSAPEIVRSCGLPSFSADVWSVMCVLVEMLTGVLPWCFESNLEQYNVILLVGGYNETEEYFKRLVPYENLQLDEDVVALFRAVLKKDPKSRPTALDLLRHQLIKDAHEYEKLFDEYEHDGYEPTPPPPPIDEVSAPICNTTETDNTQGRVSFDSGKGSSTERSSSNISSPSSVGSGSTFSSRITMDRHQSVPNTSSQTSNLENLETKLNAIRLELDKNSHAVSTFVTHSLSAPSDFGCWEERYNFHGESDDEKDGPSNGQNLTSMRVLKRTASAQYVSNGPEADSPEGRRTSRSLPPGAVETPLPSSHNVMMSVGTQTNFSPTIESRPLISVTQTSSYYNSPRNYFQNN